MALCVLAADWKKEGLSSATKGSKKFIDGMLAIIVDHGLRAESETEAKVVQRRVLNMGITTFFLSSGLWNTLMLPSPSLF